MKKENAEELNTDNLARGRSFAVALPIEDAMMNDNSSDIQIMSEIEVRKLCDKNNSDSIEDLLTVLTEANDEFDYIGSWVEITSRAL